MNCANPFTVIVPVLLCELGFDATVTPNVDGLAVPPPKEIVIQGTSAVALLKQLVGMPEAEMLLILSPVAFAVAELGLKVMEEQACPNPL